MITFIKTLFTSEIKENAIAAQIEIKEMPASDWWA